MKKIFTLLISAVAAWIAGLSVILGLLYFTNGGADFTVTDLMGFGVLFLVVSTVMMLLVYLPGLFWFRHKSRTPLIFPVLSGLVFNLPIFAFLTILIGRKMSASEAIGFMLTFLVAGAVFGFGFRKSEYVR